MRADRFRVLAVVLSANAHLVELEKRLSARSCRHKRRITRPAGIRLLVANRDFDIAFRVLVEYSAELSPNVFPGFVSQASRSSAVGE